MRLDRLYAERGAETLAKIERVVDRYRGKLRSSGEARWDETDAVLIAGLDDLPVPDFQYPCLRHFAPAPGQLNRQLSEPGFQIHQA